MSRRLDAECLQTALAAARAQELLRIWEAVRGDRVVGVFGEAEVGKTRMIEQALPRAGMPVLRVSAKTGQGMDAWLASLPGQVGQNQSADI